MHHDPTLPWRIGAGLVILALLAARSIRREGWRARRLREYAFLIGAVTVAMAYGVVHDAVCYAISPEYYIIGKGMLAARAGYFPAVFLLAMKTTWSAGLVVAALLLLANNPDRQGRSLPLLRLLPYGALVMAISAIAELAVSALVISWPGVLAHWLGFEEALAELGPAFLAVWAMHWTAYLAGALGAVMSAGLVIHRKRRQAPGAPPAL